MVDSTAQAFQLAGDDVFCDVPDHVDRVGAQSTNHSIGDAEGGRDDEELVVALEAVDLHHLYRAVTDVEPSAEDALLGNGYVVGELCGENDQLIEASTTLNRDRCVDVVLHLVLAAAGSNVKRSCGGEAEADHRAGSARHRIQRDDIVLPLRRVGGCGECLGASDVGIGVVANAVAVLVLTSGGRVPAFAAVANVLCCRAGAIGVRIDWEVRSLWIRRQADIGPATTIAGIRIGVADGCDCEGTHDEEIVVVIAFEPQLGLVGVDDKFVVPRAAGGDQWGMDARTQPTASGRNEDGERVVWQQRSTRFQIAFSRSWIRRILIAFGAEDLADLEHVVTGTAVQCHDSRCVITEEGVVAFQAEDAHPTIESGVVVDALNFEAGLISNDAILVKANPAVWIGVASQERDERRSVGRFAGRIAGRRDTG